MEEVWNVVFRTILHSRFPTSLESDGSDAVHPDPDYSAVYVRLTTDAGHSGHGLAFSLGRGNEIICHCVDSLRFLVVGKQLKVSLNLVSKVGSTHFPISGYFREYGGVALQSKQ